MHKNFNSSRNKAQETTEEVEKNFRGSRNNETRDLPISVNMIHVTDNRIMEKLIYNLYNAIFCKIGFMEIMQLKNTRSKAMA